MKDVLAVTFGVERRRDLGAEYDMGLREYPWIEYVDPATSKTMYSNRDSGIVTEMKPHDFDARAKPTSRIDVDAGATAITVVKTEKSAWQRTLDSVTNAPIISSILAAGEAVAAGPVGQQMSKVKAKVTDKLEDAREVWETSQHP